MSSYCLRCWVSSLNSTYWSDLILEVDEDVILTWRQMVEKGRKQGYTFSQPDLFIAAIALLHDLCVVTRNITDFEKSGVTVFNPFTDFQLQ